MNLIDLAIGDLGVAAALLRNKRSGVVGLDIRELRGGRVAFASGPISENTYCDAIDAGLRRLRGLKSDGYVLRASA